VGMFGNGAKTDIVTILLPPRQTPKELKVAHFV